MTHIQSLFANGYYSSRTLIKYASDKKEELVSQSKPTTSGSGIKIITDQIKKESKKYRAWFSRIIATKSFKSLIIFLCISILYEWKPLQILIIRYFYYNKKNYENHKHKYHERMPCEYCCKNIRRYGANKRYNTKKGNI